MKGRASARVLAVAQPGSWLSSVTGVGGSKGCARGIADARAPVTRGGVGQRPNPFGGKHLHVVAANTWRGCEGGCVDGIHLGRHGVVADERWRGRAWGCWPVNAISRGGQHLEAGADGWRRGSWDAYGKAARAPREDRLKAEAAQEQRGNFRWGPASGPRSDMGGERSLSLGTEVHKGPPQSARQTPRQKCP
jgi:hypothetical protein